ncbi:MAG: gluconate 2-dehydrogenase subunit 3 family protein [Pseudomonadota bacterium]
MTDQSGFAVDRRALMRGAILLVGGVVAGLPEAAFARAPAAAAFFSATERATLDAVCATMIPRTDTPGAIEAGVPAFIDGMMVHWANDATQARFRAALADIDGAAVDGAGKAFVALSAAQQLEVLRDYDSAALEVRNRNYLQLKELALMGYYLSEAGATQELRYELAPGVWEPSVPVTADTRAWAV